MQLEKNWLLRLSAARRICLFISRLVPYQRQSLRFQVFLRPGSWAFQCKRAVLHFIKSRFSKTTLSVSTSPPVNRGHSLTCPVPESSVANQPPFASDVPLLTNLAFNFLNSKALPFRDDLQWLEVNELVQVTKSSIRKDIYSWLLFRVFWPIRSLFIAVFALWSLVAPD